MGNTVPKYSNQSEIGFGIEIVWDADNKREKHIDPYAYYTFHFYGEYSREVFLKANIEDPELEDKVKSVVERFIWNTNNSKFTGWASHLWHKGRKYLVSYNK